MMNQKVKSFKRCPLLKIDETKSSSTQKDIRSLLRKIADSKAKSDSVREPFVWKDSNKSNKHKTQIIRSDKETGNTQGAFIGLVRRDTLKTTDVVRRKTFIDY